MQLPSPSANAIEDAKTFAADIVNPKPEPVETSVDLDTDTLLKVSISPDIAAALAAEGLVIDQDAITQVIADRTPDISQEVTPDPDVVAEPVYEPIELVDVTPEAFRDFKEEVNASFGEIANLLLETQRQITEVEKRLEEHNKRGGHKI